MKVKVEEKDGTITYVAKGNQKKGFEVRYHIEMKPGHDDLTGHVGSISVDERFETYWFTTEHEDSFIGEGGMKLMIKLGRKILKKLNK